MAALIHRKRNIRENFRHQLTNSLVKREPSFLCIEDLNVKGMMKNRHLSKAVASQKFHEFRTKLKAKCEENIFGHT